jgi:hypothetical protein
MKKTTPTKAQRSLHAWPLNIKIIPRSAHTVYLCVLCGSQNKQRSFPYTTLTDWFVQLRRRVFTERYGLDRSVFNSD